MKNKYFKNLIFLLALSCFIHQIEIQFDVAFSLLRYSIYTLTTYLLIKNIKFNVITIYQKNIFIALSTYLIIIFSIYSIVLAFPDILSEKRDYIAFKRFIGGQFMLFLFPLFLFLSPNLMIWKNVLKYSYLFLYLFIFFISINFIKYFVSQDENPEDIVRYFAGATGFLILISSYFSNKKRKFIFFVFILSVFLMLLHARRNMILYFTCCLFFLFFITFFITKNRLSKVSLFTKSILSAVFIFIFIAITNINFDLFFERANTGFESREIVIEEFGSQINPASVDFYLGRGINGSFFSNSLGFDDNGERASKGGERAGIENGYLQIILKNGYIYLISFIILSLYAAFFGLFKSENLLSKSCGAFLIINLIDMIGFGVPELHFKYLLIWLSFGVCLTKKFRELDDNYIKQQISI